MRRGAAALGALALVSAALGLRVTVPELSDLHRQFSAYDEREAEHAVLTHERLPADVWDGFRARLRPGDRFYLRTPRGQPVGFVDRRTVLRTFASYWLLPALQTLDPDSASVTLTYGVPSSAGDCVRPGYCVVRR